MRIRNIITAMLACTGIAAGASAQYTPAAFSLTNVDFAFVAQDLNGAAAPAGTYTTYAVNVSWTDGGAGAQSVEARFGLFSQASTDANPAGTVYFNALGAATGSGANSLPATLSWNGTLTTSYTGGAPLFFNARQTFAGAPANWNNVTVTMGGFSGPAQPATNTSCATATPVGALPWVSPNIDISAVANTDPAGLTFACATTVRRAVWYTFTPATTGSYTFQTCTGQVTQATVPDTVLGVFTLAGDCDTGTFTAVACDLNACGTRSRITTDLTAGTQYYIVLGKASDQNPLSVGETVQQMRVNFNPPGPVPPTNDLCTGAIPITGLNNVGDTYLSQAVASGTATEAGDPLACVTVRRGIWYTYQNGASAQNIRLSTCAADAPETTRADTTMAVYTSSTGQCGGTYTQVACVDDAGPACTGLRSSLNFTAAPNTTYYVLVFSYGTSTPAAGEALQFRATLLAPPPTPPSNDECAGAIDISTDANQAFGSSSNFLSTAVAIGAALPNVGTDPAVPCATAARYTIWYKYTPATSGLYTISTCAADAPGCTVTGTTFAVYSGTACPTAPFTALACNTGTGCGTTRAGGVLALQAGTTYYMAIGRTGTTALGAAETAIQFQLRFTAQPPAPGNDECAAPIDISTDANTAIAAESPYTAPAVNVLGANTSAGDPAAGCSATLARTIFYTFTPALDGLYTIRAGGSSAAAHNMAGTVVAIYTGSCGSLTQVACSNAGTAVGTGTSIQLTSGTTYTIMMASNTAGLLPNQDTYQLAVSRFNVPPGTFPETEPNDTKAAANSFTITGCSNTITGLTTGVSTTVAGDGSADYYLLELPIPTGIVRYRITVDSPTPGHTLTVRGLAQAAGVPTAGGDTEATASLATRVPNGGVEFYAHGTVAPRLYIRVAGTTATTSPYVLRFDCSPVTPTEIAGGSFTPGSITIDGLNQGHTTDTDMWIYDSSFNAIPDWGNDDAFGVGVGPSRITRTFAAGTYYVAMTRYNLANNLGSPTDDNFRTGTVLDFPGVTVKGVVWTTPPVNCQFSVSDGTPRVVAASMTTDNQILWYRLQVGATGPVACNPADIAASDGSAGADQCVNNGDFQLFFQTFFSADCPNCGQTPVVQCGPSDIASSDGSPGPDGCVNNGDFQLFFSSFFSANCPGCAG